MTTSPEPKHPGAPSALPDAVARLLRPLVRLLIRFGVTYPMLDAIVRRLYVEVAQHDLDGPGRALTDSGIHVLTGIHRKEIRRLRSESRAAQEVPAAVSLGAQVISTWVGRAPYVDPQGRPLPLPRTAPEGTPSFESLVAGLTKDVRPRAILDEWLRLGLVTVTAEDRIRLELAAYGPRQGLEERLFFFGRNLHDHMAAASINLAAEVPPFLDRSLHFDRLSPDSVKALEALGREQAMRLLLDLNREALRLAEADEGRSDASWRFNLGVYLYTADEAALEEEQRS